MQHLLLRIALVMLFGGIGLFFSWATVRAFTYRRRWLREAIVLPGRVVRLKERHLKGTRNDTPVFSPVVSFTSPDGEKTFTSSVAEGSSPYKPGQEVLVRYLAGEKSPAQLDDEVRSVFFHLAIGVLALAFLAFAAIIALR